MKKVYVLALIVLLILPGCKGDKPKTIDYTDQVFRNQYYSGITSDDKQVNLSITRNSAELSIDGKVTTYESVGHNFAPNKITMVDRKGILHTDESKEIKVLSKDEISLTVNAEKVILTKIK